MLPAFQVNFGVLVVIVPAGDTGTGAVGVCPLIVHVNVTVVRRTPSDAVTVTVEVPAVVGAPAINPVPVVRSRPAGRPDAL